MKRFLRMLPLLGCLALAMFLAFRPAQPSFPGAPVTSLAQPYRLPSARVSLFERCVPTTSAWGWLWRLKERIVGQRKAVNLDALVVRFTGESEAIPGSLSLGSPAFISTQGLRVWLLNESELKVLKLKMTPGNAVLYAPKAMTFDGGAFGMSQSTPFVLANSPIRTVGLQWDCLPQVRDNAVDLSAILVVSRAVTNQPGTPDAPATGSWVSIETNLALGVRMQITNRGGAFLLDAGSQGGGPGRLGVLLSATLPLRKQ